ncbi:hypothetical protein LOZ02_004273 [Ophidiomyces ophidiicola]|nr:hypothetical protein LOZ02_004273 [Ophidiomyces ophidiicola]
MGSSKASSLDATTDPISDSNDTRLPSSRTTGIEFQSQPYIHQPDVSLSRLSTPTPLSSLDSVSSCFTATSQSGAGVTKPNTIRQTENIPSGADGAALLPVTTPLSSSSELSSISPNSLLQSPSSIASQKSLLAVTHATSGPATMSDSSTTQKAPLKKLAPSPATEVNKKSVANPDPQVVKTPQRWRKRTLNRGKRRRAGEYDDDGESIVKAGNSSSDESDEFTPLTTQTKSGRQVHRPMYLLPDDAPASISGQSRAQSSAGASLGQTPPRKQRRVYKKGREVNITCERCDRGYSPQSNSIVFCDDCNGAWHQYCHDPPIKAEVIAVKEAQWFCSECKPVNISSSNRGGTAEPPVKAIGSTATSHDSHSPQLVGGSSFTQAERLQYLSHLSHAALVELLAGIANSDPNLPIFPVNLKDLPSSSTIAPLPISQTSSKTVEDTPQAQSSASTPVTAAASATRHAEYDSDEEYVAEHRLYPKPGNGFRLPPDSFDLNMLLEDPNCPTFSHILHGPKAKVTGISSKVSIGQEAAKA